jgi:dipeptidyl aminopeptidase/acylaminoacyl peptidase
MISLPEQKISLIKLNLTMKNLIPIFMMVLLFAGCQSTDSAEESPADLKQYTIEQFMGNISIGGSSFSHDESKILISSNQTGIYNAYEVSTEGGEPKALTDSEGSSIFAVSYFPEDDRFLYRMDDNGNEIWHLYVQDPDGTSTELTPDSMARAVFYGWAHDLKSFFYGYTKRDPRFTDVYEMTLDGYESKLLYEIESGFSFNGISNDKKYMVLSKSINTNDSDLYLYNFETEELKKISENQAAHSLADFSPDSQSLYYLTDDGSEFQYLTRYDIGYGTREKVHEEEWDIWYSYFSHDGNYQIMGINEDGKTTLKVTERESGNPIDFPKFENGDITSASFSRSGNLMAFYVGSSSAPSDLYVYDLNSKEHKKLTNSLNPEINSEDLVTATVARFESFDGVEVPGIFYKSKLATADNPQPALIWVHGGPGGQSRQNYRPLIQYLVNHGYSIYAINNRGSSGYGKTFFKMDNQAHGEGDLQDCVSAKKWMAGMDFVDENRIGIIGGSYGGFMVMAALTSEPEVFDVGVNIYGVTNWLRTLKSIPPWWESFKDALYEEMGDPYQDSVRLHRISPLFHADKIVKPLMVLQGAQDPRVLQVESDEIVAAARANDIPVEYLLFEDEGHGFVKKENQIKAYSNILQFLDTYLKEIPEKG